MEWFLDASSYTGFHKALARKIIPHLKADDTLCDAGCGLGRLGIELAPYVKELTAVDVNEEVIAAVRRDADAAGLRDLHTKIIDAELLTERFDVVLMSFFGESNFSHILKLCRRKLIRIVSASNSSSLYPERYRCTVKSTVPGVEDELRSMGIDFSLELHSIEFGQPLRSRQSAERFILNNAPEATGKEVADFLGINLVNTGRDDFPFYLPAIKELGIFTIDVTIQYR
jgi:SAM-dependent methyltransferase